jgi:hypothetical protein
MKFAMPFDFNKDRRKYPIQRDEDGRSLRQRCFALFKQGKKSKEVALILRMKLSTACRYHSEWNRNPPALDDMYKYLKKELKKKGELSPKIIGMIGKALGIPEWEALRMVSKPYGLKQLIMGDLLRQRKKQSYHTQEQRLEAALSLVVLHERSGIPIEWIIREMKKLTQMARKYKETRSDDPSRDIEIGNDPTEDRAK